MDDVFAPRARPAAHGEQDVSALIGMEPDEPLREAVALMSGPVELVAELIRARDRQAVEILDLRAALASRAVIDQAKGILMARYRATPDQAFAVLRRWSMTRNIKLRVLAQTLVEAVSRDADRATPPDHPEPLFLGKVDLSVPAVEAIGPPT